MRQRGAEIKAFDLRSHKRMERPHHGASRQQVHSAPPELTRARSCQYKPPAILGLDERVDNIKQVGDALDLVDNYCLPVRRAADEIPQTLGTRMKFPGDIGLEKVNEESIREKLSKQRRLARSSGAEQKKALPWRLEESTL